MTAFGTLFGHGHGGGTLGTKISLLFGAIFLAYGVVVPYFPVWLDARGLDPWQIATVTAAPLFLRVFVTPAVGLLADRLENNRAVLIALSLLAVVLVVSVGMVNGYVPILLVGVAFLIANGTMMPLIETVAVSAVRRYGIDYGRMRLWGSLTFIVANFLGGLAIEAMGGSFALWMMAVAGVCIVAASWYLPPEPGRAFVAAGRPRIDWQSATPARLLGNRLFVLFLIAIGCTHGAHATFYTFGAIHWQAQGLSAAWVGTLWAVGVLAEVLLFAYSAPIARVVGPVQLIVLGAAAAVLRWGAMAFDPPLALLLPLQALHALTYGAAHLGAILFISRAVPAKGLGSAQALYSTIAAGLVTGIVGLASGALYARLAGEIFFLPMLISALGAAAAFALWRRWDGRLLWPEVEASVSPTAAERAG
jgi:PPP family 3-phenylpropionic acid transporter